MDYKKYIEEKINNVNFKFNESKLIDCIKQIEAVIQKPIPVELKDFYSFCDGLEWIYNPSPDGTGASMIADLPTLEEMFDGFRTQPDLNITEWDNDDENWMERSAYFHRSIFLEDVSPYDDERLDISTEEGRNYFLTLSNMKLICNFNGHEGTIVIDFHVTKKPYQLYYQVYGDLMPLNLTLEQFYKVFLQIGLTHFWFSAYMSIEDQEELGVPYTEETHKVIKQYCPTFDLNQLPLLSV